MSTRNARLAIANARRIQKKLGTLGKQNQLTINGPKLRKRRSPNLDQTSSLSMAAVYVNMTNDYGLASSTAVDHIATKFCVCATTVYRHLRNRGIATTRKHAK